MFGLTKEKKVMVSLTRTEYRLAWDALMTLRKKQQAEGRYTDAIDELLLKLQHLPYPAGFTVCRVSIYRRTTWK